MLKRKRKYRAYLQPKTPSSLPKTTYRRHYLNKNIPSDSNEPTTSASVHPSGRPSPNKRNTDGSDSDTPSLQSESTDSTIENSSASNSNSLRSNVTDSDSTSSHRLSDSTEVENSDDPSSLSDVEVDDETTIDDPKSGSFFEELNEIVGQTMLSKFEMLLLVLLYSVRHGLTTVAVIDLIKMINVILGFTKKALVDSKFYLSKIFSSNIAYDYHVFCPKCSTYVGKKQKKNITYIFKCQTCNENVTFATSDCGSPNYFISVSMKDQLKNLLENNYLQQKLNYRCQSRSESEDIIKDIYDGAAYKKLSKEGQILSNKNNFSITFNTDGAPVFKSSKYSVWPIQFFLNELPPSDRYSAEHIMIAGLWFGEKEPQMSLFLRPFVEQTIELANSGVDWVDINGRHINSKIVTLSCCVDSVAKPLVQCVKQFNGYFGCGYCKHPGTLVEGSQVRFTVIDNKVETEHRTNKGIRNDMMEAFNTGTVVNGVKTVSPLIAVPYFDLTFGFTIDYMHACLLGVSRTLSNLWFDSAHHNEQYYIGREVAKVDKRLSTITPPSSITRNPRPISDRSHWKANEWRCWLLFYSLPCLSGILPRKYLNHLGLLVTSIYILLQEEISHEELIQANTLLLEFVRQFQTFYGPYYMTINVHLLIHMSRTVKLYGPLWVYSAFIFESCNGYILKLIHGTRGVSTQIVQKFLQQKSIPKCLERYSVSKNVLDHCDKLFSSAHVKHFRQESNITLLGSEKKKILSDQDKTVFTDHGVQFTHLFYYRMIYNGIKYHCSLYSKPKRNNDCVVQFVDGGYGIIERILVTKTSNEVMILANKLNVTNRSILSNVTAEKKVAHIQICHENIISSKILVPVSQIQKKCLFFEVDKVMYLSTFPNIFEKD